MDYTQNIPAFLALLQGYLAESAREHLPLIYQGQTQRPEFALTHKLLSSLQVLLLLEARVTQALAEEPPAPVTALREQEALIVSYCLTLCELTDVLASPYGVSLPLISRYTDPCGCDGEGGGGSTSPPAEVTVTLNGVTETLGGFTPGDYGQLLNQAAWEKLLIREQFPSYVAPSASLGSSRTGLVKAGALLTVDLTPAFAQHDAGPLGSYALQRLATDVTTLAGDSSAPVESPPFTDTYVAGEELITYRASYTYAQGPQQLSSAGNPAPGRIGAGQVLAEAGLQGILPWYYGSSTADVTPNIYGGNEVLGLSGGTLQVPGFGSGSGYLWFAVPRTSLGARQKLFTAWLRTALDNGAIGGGSNLFRSPAIVAVTSTNLARNWTRDYDLYFSNYPTAAGVATTLT